jgi:enamine deaminase RidA (YjgF/YER057c/UK114 family)
MSITDRLAEHGITLPEPAAPVAAYVPAVRVGNLLHISGSSRSTRGAVMTGRLGEDRDLDYGRAAARACGIMLLAQIKKALGLAGKRRADREARRIREQRRSPSPISPRSRTAPPR